MTKSISPIRHVRKWSALALALLAALFFVMTSFEVSAQAPRPLFEPARAGDEQGLKSGQRRLLRLLRELPTTSRLELVRATNQTPRGDTSVYVNLNGLGLAHFVRSQLVERSSDDYTWIGAREGDDSSAVLVIKAGAVTGDIRVGTRVYSIRSLGGGLHALVTVDPTKFPKDHPSSSTLRLPDGSQMLPTAPTSPGIDPAAPVKIDVLVAYTTAAAKANYNTIAGLPDLAIHVTNVAYYRSKINIQLRMVGTIQVKYEETDVSQPLSDLIAGRGVMAAVHAERKATGADIVLLLLKPKLDACGKAPIGASVNTSFAVVTWNCIDGHSAGHEMGHLFGARHDPATDSAQVPFPHGHGHISADRKWRTIMAYPEPCGGCPRIQQFADPAISYDGQPTGTATLSNVARVHRDRAATIGSFLPPTPITAPPTALPATNVLPNGFMVRWTKSGGARSYRLDVTDDPSFLSIPPPYHNIIVASSGSPFGWTVGAGPGTTYYYRFRSVNAAGDASPNSNVEKVTTAKSPRPGR